MTSTLEPINVRVPGDEADYLSKCVNTICDGLMLTDACFSRGGRSQWYGELRYRYATRNEMREYNRSQWLEHANARRMK